MAAEKSDPPRPIVVVMPARLAPMNPPMTGTCPRLQQWLNLFLKLGVGLVELRNGLHVGAVGDEDVARVDVSSVEAAGGEGGGDDFAGEHLAEGGDMVGGARSDLADGRDAAQQFVEIFEVGAQFGMKFSEAGPCREVRWRYCSGAPAASGRV